MNFMNFVEINRLIILRTKITEIHFPFSSIFLYLANYRESYKQLFITYKIYKGFTFIKGLEAQY